MSFTYKCKNDDCIEFHLYGGYLVCVECRQVLNTSYIEVKEV